MSLALEAVGVRVGDATLLADATMHVAAGEIVVLLGPNGAGKTTLFTVASGLRRTYTGRVGLDERPLDAWPAEALAQRRAVMTQTSTLAFAFRVHEVVMLGRAPHRGGSSAREDARIVDAAMARADVTAIADRIYTTLSGGERQRVHLARALAQVWPSPETSFARFLLLDEPTASLDLKHQSLLLEIARDFASEGGGVLMILHDLNLASMVADRIALMKGGRIVAQGTPVEILTRERITSVYEVEARVERHPTSGRPVVTPSFSAPPARVYPRIAAG